MKKKSLLVLTGAVMLGLCACSGAGKSTETQTEPAEKIAADGGIMNPTAPLGVKVAEIDGNGNVKGAANDAAEAAGSDDGGIAYPTAPAGIKIAEVDDNGNVTAKIRIPDDAGTVLVTYTENDERKEWTVESDNIRYLRDWLDGLEYEPVTFIDGEIPGSTGDEKSYTFEPDGEDGFSYVVCALDEAYLKREDEWFRVKNPSEPTIIATAVSCSSEYPADGKASENAEADTGNKPDR